MALALKSNIRGPLTLVEKIEVPEGSIKEK